MLPTLDDPATVKDWLTFIAIVLWPGTFFVGCVLVFNYCWDHWGWWCRIRWHRLVRYVLWLAVNLPIADTDADWWLTPPPIPPSRHRR